MIAFGSGRVKRQDIRKMASQSRICSIDEQGRDVIDHVINYIDRYKKPIVGLPTLIHAANVQSSEFSRREEELSQPRR